MFVELLLDFGTDSILNYANEILIKHIAGKASTTI